MTLMPVVGGAVAAGLLANALLIGLLIAGLHHAEKKERRALANRQKLSSAGSESIEEKTVIVENRGPIGGTAGMAEVVTTGPAGTQVSTVPTVGGGAVVMETTSAGIPGHTVTVEQGRTAVVKGEHPVGRPEEVKVVSETHS